MKTTTSKTPYGLVKSLLASVPDPAAVTIPAFTRQHGLKLNSVFHAARRLGLRFKDQKTVKVKQEVRS